MIRLRLYIQRRIPLNDGSGLRLDDSSMWTKTIVVPPYVPNPGEQIVLSNEESFLTVERRILRTDGMAELWLQTVVVDDDGPLTPSPNQYQRTHHSWHTATDGDITNLFRDLVADGWEMDMDEDD